MVKIDEEKLHRHGNAVLRLEQKGEDIKINIDGHKYDILHMLMAVIKRHMRLGRLFEQAVLTILKQEFHDTNVPNKGKRKKERSIN